MTQRPSGHYVPVGGNVTLYVEDVGEGKPVVPSCRASHV